jgi:hypothetical protein
VTHSETVNGSRIETGCETETDSVTLTDWHCATDYATGIGCQTSTG